MAMPNANDPLGDWHHAMVAKGRRVKHADLSQKRATRVASLAGAPRLGDLQPAKIQHALAKLKDEGLSLESVNHHRACIRAFVRWARADGRLRDDPMLGVTGFCHRALQNQPLMGASKPATTLGGLEHAC